MSGSILKMDYNVARKLSKKCANICDLVEIWEKQIDAVCDALKMMEEPSAKQAAVKAAELKWELTEERTMLRYMSENLEVSARKIKAAQDSVMKNLQNSGEGQ